MVGCIKISHKIKFNQLLLQNFSSLGKNVDVIVTLFNIALVIAVDTITFSKFTNLVIFYLVKYDKELVTFLSHGLANVCVSCAAYANVSVILWSTYLLLLS